MQYVQQQFQYYTSIGLICSFIFLFSACNGWYTSLSDSSPKQLIQNKQYDFKGKIIIIGAGAAGLAAASILEENGIDYQIIEATDHYGGRVQKKTGFADFPIDAGAEWIHHKASILNKLKGKNGAKTDEQLIPYRTLNVYYWDGETYSKVSKLGPKLRYWAYPEYKFKNTTWFDYLEQNFAQKVKHNIVYNSPVTQIDYSGKQVKITTKSGKIFMANKVISTVSIGVLKSDYITFTPQLSEEKKAAIQSVDFQPGFKLMLKFSEKFYPDVVDCATETGEKTYYDVAFQKGAKDHVFGLLSMGSSAKVYYKLGSEEKIVSTVLKELDQMYDGKASKTYTGNYLFKDWGKHPFTLGTWTSGFAEGSMLKTLRKPLNNKVFFAGETYNSYEQGSTVHGAIMSGYETVYNILDQQEQP